MEVAATVTMGQSVPPTVAVDPTNAVPVMVRGLPPAGSWVVGLTSVTVGGVAAYVAQHHTNLGIAHSIAKMCHTGDGR